MKSSREMERMMNVVMYVASLSQSAYRFARNQAPFDFEDTATAEFLMARYLPFIEDENVDYKVAHQAFIQNIVECGWVHGSENFKARTHPDIVSWEDLPQETKEMYAYTAAMVCSARGFYQSLKADFEEDFMNSFEKPMTILGTKKMIALQC
jgi:hypothetical protein